MPNPGGSNHRAFGFTLVELIVSIAMAGILMLGLSTFFASTFHNLFLAQAENASSERQYAVNQIVADKFLSMQKLVKSLPAFPATSDSLFSFGLSERRQLPFTYIGKVNIVGKNYLGFKDMLVFNKIIYDENYDGELDRYLFGDSGDGFIRNAANTNDKIELRDSKGVAIKNFAGFVKMGASLFVAVPSEHEIWKCASDGSTGCNPMEIADFILDSPMDVATDGTKLYISDSGNDRILRCDFDGRNAMSIAQGGLAFPTGLAYYEKDASNRYLFFADTFNHKVRRIDLGNFAVTIVAGNGNDKTCNKTTARLCELNLPTGLFTNVKDELTGEKIRELYIADSGNNRVLKVSDPGKPTDVTFSFNLSDGYRLDRINLSGGGWTTGNYVEAGSNLIGNSSHWANKTFSNPSRLTVYSQGACVSGGTTVYVNEDVSGMNLEANDRLVINNGVYELSSPPVQSGDCDANPDITIKKTQITLKTAIPVAPSAGDIIYLSNPVDATIKIGALDWGTTQGGFLTTNIETYDVSKGLVETDPVTLRVGDGVLGTVEDIVEAVSIFGSPPLVFPTGVSNVFVSNTLLRNVIRFSDGATNNLDSVSSDFTDSTDFDYVSDFEIGTLEFQQLNGGGIVEMTLTTPPDDSGNQETYIHDAVLQ